MEILIPSQIKYIVLAIKDNEDHYSIVIIDDSLNKSNSHLDIDKYDSVNKYFSPKLLNYLSYFEKKLKKNYIKLDIEKKDSFYDFKNENALRSIEDYCTTYFKSISAEKGELIDEFTKVIVSNINHDDILKFYCETKNVGLPSLRSTCFELININPKQLVTLLKLCKACEILINTPMPIKAIALSVGFEETAHFIKTFKMVINQTPTEYRISYIKSAFM